ncbi:spaetzle-processing enzyme [Drosophila eugracilis]|uniref:spaetzle-processing enzyme n=1 Tax=Drosophila eugracilis TaxID=29029 RepID=UPI0007E618DF|nr:spaetzle-processing enzyme [Drosophila eugracilis]
MLRERQCGYDNNRAMLIERILVCCPQSGNILPNQMICGQSPAVFRLSNDKEAELNQFPWMALLLYRNRLTLEHDQSTLCAGSLINNRYVLTAANCVIRAELIKNDLVVKGVRLGEHDRATNPDCITHRNGWHMCAPPPLEVNVEHITVHQYFKEINRTYYNDIALLRLHMPVRYTKEIQPLCLLRENSQPRAFGLELAGWGLSESQPALQKLSYALLKEWHPHACSKSYPAFHHVIQLCAAGKDRHDTCVATPGSPLIGTMGRGFDEYRFVEGIGTKS